MARFILTLALLAAGGPALAQPAQDDFVAACMSATEESETTCNCVVDSLRANLDDDQQTFAYAILTEDEALLTPLRGRFTDADAQGVQARFMNAAMQCMG